MIEQEREIFASAHRDYDVAFAKLFSLYCDQIYAIALAASYYNESAAWQLTHDVFATAYKYVHTFQPQQSSFRLHLFTLLVGQLSKREQLVPPTKDGLPKKLAHHLTPAEQQTWFVIHQLPYPLWLTFELNYGANLSVPELSIVLTQSVTEVQQLQAQASHRLRQQLPTFMEQVMSLFQKRNHIAQITRAKQQRMLHIILEQKRLGLTFVQRSWWQRLFQPTVVVSVVVAIGGGAVIALGLWYRETNRTLPNTESVSTLWQTVVTQRRPSFLTSQGELPEVSTNRTSLTDTDDKLYGSDYVFDHGTVADADELQPTFTVNIVAEDYIPVAEAYTYTVPEALTEDQLQYAALRHFVSLPLNQFTYVNGTYYIEDDPADFRPLFISFNNTGSIDFQMRQAAICALDKLTEPIADTQAQSNGYDFLLSHHFVEVKEGQLQINQVSSVDRTVAKDAFCQDGDTTAVQDREIVYYLSHTLLRYGSDPNQQMVMRQRGVAVQLHGKHVTNMRVDPLFLLQQYAERGGTIPLKPLSQAITELQQYRYTAERNNVVFPQWNHSHGTDRLQNMTIDTVRLEYVYDELNHLIEPYYVFSGFGTDLNDKVLAANWYVVASTQATELRAPYRE